MTNNSKAITELNSNIGILNSKYDDCFQSVSSGKAKVASAITGKGVTTASDATFDTMASNIGKVVTGKLINLGTGTSWNVQSVCASNGIDYTKLNTGNFIVGVVSVGSKSTAQANTSYYNYYGYATGSGTLSYSYSNGVLSVTGGHYQQIGVYNPTDKKYFCPLVVQNYTIRAWLFYAG